jgi:hypothetical protein
LLELAWTLVCAATIPAFLLQALRRRSTLRLAGAARRLTSDVRIPGRREAALGLIARAFARSLPNEESLAKLLRPGLRIREVVVAVGAYCLCYVVVAPLADLYDLFVTWRQGYLAEPGVDIRFALAWPAVIALGLWSKETEPEEDDARYWLSLAEQGAADDHEVEPVQSPTASMF